MAHDTETSDYALRNLGGRPVILMEHVCDALRCPGLHAPEITQNAVDLQPPGSLAKFCQRPTSIHKYFMHNMFHTQLSCVTIWRWVPNPSPHGDLRFVHLDVAKSCAAGGSWTSWCCMRCFNVFNVYLTIKYRDSTNGKGNIECADLGSDDPVHHIPHRQKGKKNAFL